MNLTASEQTEKEIKRLRGIRRIAVKWGDWRLVSTIDTRLDSLLRAYMSLTAPAGAKGE